jgi:hypothetical protein
MIQCEREVTCQCKLYRLSLQIVILFNTDIITQCIFKSWAIISAALCPIMQVMAIGGADGASGATEASATRKPAIPNTLQRTVWHL